MLKCEIQKQDQIIKDLELELIAKRKSLAQDIQHARAEAAMMLQSHGINPGKEIG